MIAPNTEQSLRVTAIERFDALQGLEDSWNALLRCGYHDHIFISFEWISAWWKAFGKAYALFVLTVTNNAGRIVAIAPLMRMRALRYLLPARIIKYIYNDNASRTDLIIDKDCPRAADEIVSYLNALPGWDIIELPNVWRESQTFSLVTGALKKYGCRFIVKEELRSLYMKIDTDWDTYYAGRSVRFRKHFRNSENRIRRIDSHHLQCVRQVEERPESIRQLCAISKKSWKAHGNNHLASNSPDRLFFEELTQSLAKRRWLYLWMLDLNGAPVAYEYHVRYNNAIYALRSDYDERYAAYSPGTYVHLRTIKQYFDEHDLLREYEFCGNNEEYKTKWTSDMKAHGTIVVYSRSWYGTALYLIDYRLFYRCKQWLKKYPVIKRLKKIITRTR